MKNMILLSKTILIICLTLPQFCLAQKLPDLIPYHKGKLWGYCDSTKKMIIEPKYDNEDFFNKNGAVVQENGKYGIINKKGKYLAKPQYDAVFPWANDVAIYKKDGLSGVVNIKGKIIV